STAGMVLGGPIGAVAGTLLGGALGSLFGDDQPKTRRAKFATTGWNAEEGRQNIELTDSRQSTEAQEAARAAAEALVLSTNDLFSKIGIEASIRHFDTLMESSILGDRDGVASWGTVTVGDRAVDIGLSDPHERTLRGVGGRSDQPMLPRLMLDMQLTA